MTLADPFWLVLAIPLAMLLWWWRLPSRLLLRLALRGPRSCCVLALCGLSVRLPFARGTVVLVADRSLSMPPGSAALQEEAADIVHSAMPPATSWRVVSFAETAAVEQSPQSGKFAGFSAEVGREASRLADALDLALSLVGSGEPGRVLVLSDGRWTGRDVAAAAARAAAAGVAIDYRAIERPRAGDLAIERSRGRNRVLPGESFMITAWLDSPLGADGLLRTAAGGAGDIARGTQAVPAGTSRLIFRDTAEPRAASANTCSAFKGKGRTPCRKTIVPGCWWASAAARPVLCVSPAATSGLPALLAKGGLEGPAARRPRAATGRSKNWPAIRPSSWRTRRPSLVGTRGMQNLAAWVTQSGGGLMLTGGKDSYGPGGYYKSPLDAGHAGLDGAAARSTASCRWPSSWPWTAAAAWPSPCPAAGPRSSWPTWPRPRWSTCWARRTSSAASRSTPLPTRSCRFPT